jgi:oxygen-independent coproporphyrinogen-3 oxidase
MALSVYVHIPYCLQRCRYCDFTTFEQSEILPPAKYLDQIRAEIRSRNSLWDDREIKTLYFGGGTPSLVDPEFIVSVYRELSNAGFRFQDGHEGTIEINPATLNRDKLITYRRAGINRFSVGAQTFDNQLLDRCGRKHTAEDTRETLRLIRGQNLNYSFDLLFALPGQTLAGLRADLEEVASFDPPHLSAYCLTVPEGHVMSTGRPPEGEQVEMFDLIEKSLAAIGTLKYEISNFAKPGFESRHNMSYWNDSAYWGIGLSSHSYDPRGFGSRFWNSKSLKAYAEQMHLADVPADQREILKPHESLTDFCHMHLRVLSGLSEDALRQKYGSQVWLQVRPRLERMLSFGWLDFTTGHWRLTSAGQLISNKVFEELTFSAEELNPRGLTAERADSYCSDHERERGKAQHSLQ